MSTRPSFLGRVLFVTRCLCGTTIYEDYSQKYAKYNIKCTGCKYPISLRCRKCLLKRVCPNKHFICERCYVCHLCTKCSECKQPLGLAVSTIKICCQCKKIIPDRCNNCMIKRICKCGEEFCAECIGCELPYSSSLV